MEDSVNERIRRLFEIERFKSNQDFANRISVSRETVRRWFSGEKIRSENIDSILQAFPTLNEKWLRKGEGPMHSESLPFAEVREAQISYAITSVDDVIKDLKNEIESLTKQMQKKQLFIEILEKSKGSKK